MTPSQEQTARHRRLRGGHSAAKHQHGLTLVELMVAMVISMLIALAAISALTVTRRGFTTVDASSQLRDNGRFSAELIQRLAVQSGFKDRLYAATAPPPAVAGLATNPYPNINGFNNALVNSSASATATQLLDSATTRTTGQVGYGSDVLILRYQPTESYQGSGTSDQSMIDCMGNSSSNDIADNRYTRMTSIIHVAISNGEPSLMCRTIAVDGTISASQPIIQGVENFQVLYGVDGVSAGVAPPSSPGDSTPDKYLRADQMAVAGNSVATNDNWRRVRSLRIGMVLRGSVNSTQDTTTKTMYPLGSGKSSATDTEGSAMSSTDDPGSIFVPPNDGRLRQAITFTVHLRNDQGL